MYVGSKEIRVVLTPWTYIRWYLIRILAGVADSFTEDLHGW
jgi:hypothetical protein